MLRMWRINASYPNDFGGRSEVPEFFIEINEDTIVGETMQDNKLRIGRQVRFQALKVINHKQLPEMTVMTINVERCGFIK